MSTFKSLGIASDYIKGLKELGIETPTEIQTQTIPLLLKNNTDLIGQAETGTGKTAAFGLPLLSKVDASKNAVQGLILCPTRELGQQIAKQLFKFTKYTDKIFVESVYGGEKIDIQIARLSRPTHVIVATPGRLIDLLKQKVVRLDSVKTVVLDEADEMLSMGFKDQLDKILSHLSGAQNKWLFSATLPHEIKAIINTHLNSDAIRIETNTKSRLNKDIQHQHVICDDKEKLNVLIQFIKSQGKSRGVVFCRTKAATQLLAKQLQAKNMPVDAIHGDLLQREREKVMRAFRNESLQILVSTDIAARGIDVADLAFVVHYQMPDKDEYFTHRSGRTARAGRKGLSLSLVNSKELKNLRFLENKIGFTSSLIK